MTKNKLVGPFLKWVGGKRKLIPAICEFLPKNLSNLTYCEPFIGGGALFFYLQPKKSIINDYNSEVINVYQVVKDDVDELIKSLQKHNDATGPDYFYKIRSMDRNMLIDEMSATEKASRIIYLNKTCYNGLYRVNSAGEFNSPYGSYKNPNIVNEPVLRSVNKFLNTTDVKIMNSDYADVLEKLPKNSFVYLDPPYYPISETSNFTGYVEGGWREKDQVRLKLACDILTLRGIKFLLSNSSAPFIKDLYNDKNYHIHIVKATRSINSNANKRGAIDELLISNYDV
jgi:DNA adenine methylase